MARTKTFESKVIEGAKFALRLIGRQLRHRVELDLADVRHKQRMLERERIGLLPDDYAGRPEVLIERIKTMSQEETETLDRIAARMDLLVEEVQFSYLRAMLESYSIPDHADLKTADDLLESGPEAFTTEVINEAQAMWGFTPEQTKNSSRPSTSPEQVDGPIPTSDTTAQPAESGATIEPEPAS